ncbi:MAG: hypothetical protein QXY76_03335 [Nitrososphaeria archaeon]
MPERREDPRFENIRKEVGNKLFRFIEDIDKLYSSVPLVQENIQKLSKELEHVVEVIQKADLGETVKETFTKFVSSLEEYTVGLDSEKQKTLRALAAFNLLLEMLGRALTAASPQDFVQNLLLLRDTIAGLNNKFNQVQMQLSRIQEIFDILESQKPLGEIIQEITEKFQDLSFVREFQRTAREAFGLAGGGPIQASTLSELHVSETAMRPLLDTFRERLEATYRELAAASSSQITAFLKEVGESLGFRFGSREQKSLEAFGSALQAIITKAEKAPEHLTQEEVSKMQASLIALLSGAGPFSAIAAMISDKMDRRESAERRFQSFLESQLIAIGGRDIKEVVDLIKMLVELVKEGVWHLALLSLIIVVLVEMYKYYQRSVENAREMLASWGFPLPLGADAFKTFRAQLLEAGGTFQTITYDLLYTYRMTEDQLKRIIQAITTSGTFFELTFKRLTESSETLFKEWGAAPVTLVRNLGEIAADMYKLAFLVNSSVDEINRRAMELSRMSGVREWEVLRGTLIGLKEFADSLNLQYSLVYEWARDLYRSLRFLGISMGEVVGVIGEFADSLRKGVLSVQEFKDAIDKLLGKEALGVAFLTMQRRPDIFGRFLGALESGELPLATVLPYLQALLRPDYRAQIELLEKISPRGWAEFKAAIGMSPADFAAALISQIYQTWGTLLGGALPQAFLLGATDWVRTQAALQAVVPRVGGEYGVGLRPSAELETITTDLTEFLSAFKSVEQYIAEIKEALSKIMNTVLNWFSLWRFGRRAGGNVTLEQ